MSSEEIWFGQTLACTELLTQFGNLSNYFNCNGQLVTVESIQWTLSTSCLIMTEPTRQIVWLLFWLVFWLLTAECFLCCSWVIRTFLQWKSPWLRTPIIDCIIKRGMSQMSPIGFWRVVYKAQCGWLRLSPSWQCLTLPDTPVIQKWAKRWS